MAFDPVPWAIGGGADLDENTARVFANIATGDSSGIALPQHMKVSALGTPGAAVDIAPGGIVIRNVQAPGQSYIGRAATDTQVAVPPTSSSGGRSDLLVARIIDPAFSPWQPYTDPVAIANGPYFEPHLITNVPPGTTTADQVVTYSAEALCRLDLPATPSGGTFAVAGQQVVDLRRLARSRTWYDLSIVQVPGTEYVTTQQTSWFDWPLTSVVSSVPRWATHCVVIVNINGIKADGPGDVNLQLVMSANGQSVVGATNYFDYNGNNGTPAGFVEVLPQLVFAVFPCTQFQGQQVTIKPQGRRAYATQNTGNVFVDAQQQVSFDVRYSERVI